MDEHCIKVLDKSGTYMSNCSQHRAMQMTRRSAAEWVDEQTIRITYDHNDKRRFKETAMKRDNYTCYVCGKVMHRGHPEASVDHIKAKKKGGSDLPENLACCCKPCNFEKGNMDLGTFLRMKRKHHERRNTGVAKASGLSDRRPSVPRK